ADGAGAGSYSLAGPVPAGSTNNTQAATFTATTGGVAANAVVELLVPANWTAPQKTTDNAAGYTTASYDDGSNHAIASSNISITGQTVDVTVPIALASGTTLTITYGDTGSSSGGAATAPSAANAGNSIFTLKSKSTSGGTVTTLATTPSKTVAVSNSADGSGSASISPTSATAGTTNDTEVLTYTVGTGGIASGGAVTLAVPSGWTAPQTGSSSSAGYTQANIAGGYSTTGVSASGQVVTVTTASALNAADTILVR